MRKSNKPIAIVGGGIGGLTLAAALKKLGLDAVVFERAPELCEVGAGLGLWANATRCLEWLGIDEGYWEGKGCEVHAAEVGSPSGKVLSRCDIRPLSAELGARSYVVHRADLHVALASLVENEMIETGRACNGLEQSDDDIRLRFSDETEESFSLVVGADGLRSGVRASLFGKEEPLYSGQTCYRGIASLEGAEKHVLREVQGRGLRSAVISLSDDKVYWWATECIEANSDFSPEERKERLQRLFSDWKFGFPEALANTKAEAILQNDLCDRPPLRQWSSGRATLLGDAAHPMTPNLGQGACTAIEDAIVLAGLISRYGIENYATAFAAYEAERMGRCYKIMKQSRTFGKVGGWSHPAAVCFRQAAVAAMPSVVMAKMLRQQLGYRALA